jgi:hypothetical protein
MHLGFLNYKEIILLFSGCFDFEVADLTSSGLSSPLNRLASLIQPY